MKVWDRRWVKPVRDLLSVGVTFVLPSAKTRQKWFLVKEYHTIKIREPLKRSEVNRATFPSQVGTHLKQQYLKSPKLKINSWRMMFRKLGFNSANDISARWVVSWAGRQGSELIFWPPMAWPSLWWAREVEARIGFLKGREKWMWLGWPQGPEWRLTWLSNATGSDKTRSADGGRERLERKGRNASC